MSYLTPKRVLRAQAKARQAAKRKAGSKKTVAAVKAK
jgi:hypothetical protein